MSSTFTTTDGDIILRAGPDSDSKHDFRVHKFILSLASPVFKDMFAFPQPPDQTINEHQLPVVDVLDPPEVLDTILRFIYPGVEPPEITKLSTLTALLSTADKYNITSIYSALRAVLKVLLPGDPFSAYIVASRFGFLGEAKEAAKLSRTSTFSYNSPREDLRHISSTDLFRLVQFVHHRQDQGLLIVRMALASWILDEFNNCTHGDSEKAQDYYFRLKKAVEEAVVRNPCVGSKDLFAVLDQIPDPPLGCRPPSRSGQWYYEGDCDSGFSCPLQPMTIRRKLADLAEELNGQNQKILDEFFGKGVGRS